MSQVQRSVANPFFDSNVVTGYDAWYQSSGRRVDRLEKALLERL